MAAVMQSNLNDEKMYLVQKLLREGKSKFQAARAVGYQGVDGLDRYAKSVCYVWNVSIKNYELKDTAKANGLENPPERIMKILSMVKNGRDLNDIAKYFRMKTSQELAEYMKNKGYVWDVEKGNYVRKSFLISSDEPEGMNSVEGTEGADGFPDIIKLLESHKVRLIELLAYKSQKTIPRYVVKGVMVTKSFYMSTEIDRLIKEFSDWKDVPQKDIIHTALIEYFQRYGYHDETSILLKY